MKTCKTNIRVRYQETDRMGVVYYANYLVWFEVARTEYLRENGLSYRELEEKEGIGLMVKDVSCEYKAPTFYDDVLTVESQITDMKNSSLVFLYEIYRGTKLIATGKTTHVCTDKTGRPTRLPERIKETLSTVS